MRKLPPKWVIFVMKNRDSVTEYPFPKPNEINGYCLFPASLENEELVVFHGTTKSNLESIIENNFKVSGELKSISFSSNSNLALSYGCDKRSKQSPEGVVLAVKLQSLNKPHVVSSGGVILLYRPEQEPPRILAYCIIPATYVHS